jgi:hypothetical protein
MIFFEGGGENQTRGGSGGEERELRKLWSIYRSQRQAIQKVNWGGSGWESEQVQGLVIVVIVERNGQRGINCGKHDCKLSDRGREALELAPKA